MVASLSGAGYGLYAGLRHDVGRTPANDRVRRQRYTEVNSTGARPRAEREASGLRPSNLIQVMLAKGSSFIIPSDAGVETKGIYDC